MSKSTDLEKGAEILIRTEILNEDGHQPLEFIYDSEKELPRLRPRK